MKKKVKGDYIELKAIQFILLPLERVEPQDPKDFDYNYEGTVRVELCPSYVALIGSRVRLRSTGLLSCSPYFSYISYEARYQANSGTLYVDRVSQLLIKSELGRDDFIYFANEIAGAYARPAVGIVAGLPAGAKIPSEEFRQVLKQNAIKSSLERLPIQTTLINYFVPNMAFDAKQKERIMDMKLDMLQELQQMLKTCPWDLCFDEPLRAKYNRLKPLTRQAYQRAVQEFKLKPDALTIDPALNIYFTVKEEAKDTVFERKNFTRLLPFCHIDERMEIERRVFDFLEKRAITFLTPQRDWFALNNHFRNARDALVELSFIAQRSANGEPELRGNSVPTLLPPLTGRQKEIARHIQKHWLTVVEGLPGTGKTQLTMWIISHYAKVCTVAFVKMMVKALRKRNGKRPEVANSLAHVCATHKYTTMGSKWLEEFDTLIVEEMSMISQREFAKILKCLPNVRKLIVVGDHRQLPPIEAGDPMGDLIDYFGSQLLTENLRVQKHLKALQEAPALIADCKASQITFGTGCIDFLPENLTAFDLCRHVSALPRGRYLANFHVVCLTNEERKFLNKQIHEAWIKLGLLNPLQKHGFVRGMCIFPGCKIMFLQNYNKPSLVNDEVVSEPVSNGELCIVLEVIINPKIGGVQLLVADTDEPDQGAETKKVWIHEKGGIKPIHVEWGYATTAYKTQGNEFPYVLFKVPNNPGPQWTRPNAYVSVSRAKEKCWIMGSKASFLTICSRPEKHRTTCFGMMLQDARLQKEPLEEAVSDLLKPEDLELLPRDIPCVPTLEQTIEKAKSNGGF